MKSLLKKITVKLLLPEEPLTRVCEIRTKEMPNNVDELSAYLGGSLRVVKLMKGLALLIAENDQPNKKPNHVATELLRAFHPDESIVEDYAAAVGIDENGNFIDLPVWMR